MRVIAYCPQSETIVLKEVLDNELLCLHDSSLTASDRNDRMEELKDIYEYLNNLSYGKVEFCEGKDRMPTEINLDKCEVYNSVGELEIHFGSNNYIIDFLSNSMYCYAYDMRNEILPLEYYDIRTLFIH